MDGEELVKLIKAKGIEEEQVENARALLDSIRQQAKQGKEEETKDEDMSL